MVSTAAPVAVSAMIIFPWRDNSGGESNVIRSVVSGHMPVAPDVGNRLSAGLADENIKAASQIPIQAIRICRSSLKCRRRDLIANGRGLQLVIQNSSKLQFHLHRLVRAIVLADVAVDALFRFDDGFFVFDFDRAGWAVVLASSASVALFRVDYRWHRWLL
jgi:hypothetical protein